MILARAACLVLATRAHVAVDHAIRLAYVEVLPDEQKAVTEAGCFVVHQLGDHLLQSAAGQRSRLLLQVIAIGLLRSRLESQANPGLEIPDERHGRMVHPDAQSGVSLCKAVQELRGEQTLFAAISDDIQCLQLPYGQKRPHFVSAAQRVVGH